jgi:hypothetical protein
MPIIINVFTVVGNGKGSVAAVARCKLAGVSLEGLEVCIAREVKAVATERLVYKASVPQHWCRCGVVECSNYIDSAKNRTLAGITAAVLSRSCR